MFVRVLGESFRRQRGRKAIALTAVALGTATAAALANMALDIGDRVGHELRSFGANLVVLPAGGGTPVVFAGQDITALRQRAFLSSSDILKVKENFWKNNILAFAPFLDVPVSLPAHVSARRVLLRGTWFDRRVVLTGDEAVQTGVRSLYPFWSVRGDWPVDFGNAPPEDRALVGRSLAQRLGLEPGARLELEIAGRPCALPVAGIVSTGGEEDDAVLVPIETAQRLSGLEGKVDRVLVSALTTPESAVYERLAKTPRQLSPQEFERWTCTPFVSSVAFRIAEALPGSEAHPIRRIADSEGRILRRVGGLMTLIALMSALGSALAVTSALTTGVLERRVEIGLWKAMGASDATVVALFLAEAALIGLLGGAIGGTLGLVLARWVSMSVFGVAGSVKALAAVLAIAFALAIALAGSAVPARRIARLRAAEALHG